MDHASVVGATPLMLAARAGNTALVRALLERGADPARTDEFGHTAWLHAVSRALEERDFATVGLPWLFDHLAPAALDVQTQGRLVRLERSQGEYWVLTLMLAGLKTQWSRCALRSQGPWKYGQGFFAEQLHKVLDALPPWLWGEKRRKRSYVNQVLARAERSSSYRPARQLWVRARNGHYLPNPAMQLRRGDSWAPVYKLLALDWIDRGCSESGDRLQPRPLALVARLQQTGTTAPDEAPSV